MSFIFFKTLINFFYGSVIFIFLFISRLVFVRSLVFYCLFLFLMLFVVLNLNYFFSLFIPNYDFSIFMLSTFRKIGRTFLSPPKLIRRSGLLNYENLISRKMSYTFNWVKYPPMPCSHLAVICDGWDTSGSTIIYLADGRVYLLKTSNISDDISKGEYWSVGLTKNPKVNGEPGFFIGTDKNGVPRYLSDKGKALPENLFKNFKNPENYYPKTTGLNAARGLLLIKNENWILIHSYRLSEFLQKNPGSRLGRTMIKWATLDKKDVPIRVMKNWQEKDTPNFFKILEFFKKF